MLKVTPLLHTLVSAEPLQFSVQFRWFVTFLFCFTELCHMLQTTLNLDTCGLGILFSNTVCNGSEPNFKGLMCHL